MSMISLMTIHTNNSIDSLLNLSWTTFRTQHKMFVDHYNKKLEEEEKANKEMQKKMRSR